ncbi:AlpA family transcriptional regulator [Nitrosomonas sp.]|uniref:helix-turn-helix transcriptional regulator n=1 Tax=Nitrosomonas sp. TaxID=42353 RepID=UPI0020877946|nr:AlpA family phage regulatory protein [Nitrosomonas sp.]GJL73966.1 MAG: hypothetical protein NMNS02_00720 [Nitrosomonas sp.]
MNQVVSPSPEHERLITLNEVEAITGFKSSFIYSEIKKGNFPKSVKINSSSRWVKSQVDSWVRQKINGGGAK